ncbi:hypothetical protein IX307_002062 [Bacteroides pyogenes]|uniref:Uncharacterized protein n=3 Tax=Bacteroides pyogenes TaxID=310300 RepID=A0A5D3ESL9_9BACE|nr:hypothetical protein [Bacteroides pyogenes]MBR8708415.1 hypothetical protein [Bacteroides pyogenes]MBR8717011.1 hypothetical protein [Bacteroides pyogenes]MBR8720886.1 hypothetical protein [Bacteroides pyogenes]MBR8725787.1 hypothetical protein [Bacteroides pyogenes]MBR8739086.1 hypothetical protein [Bacteroides pyogenes]
MKTSMRKERVGLRKRIRYLFPAVILLCGLALFAFSCDDDDNSPSLPPPPTVEKVVLVFGVDQGEGTLSAKPVPSDKVSETVKELESPAELVKGTKVHFVASHSKSWTIKYWKINGVVIRSVEPEQTFVINEHKDVRVAFKPWNEIQPVESLEHSDTK